MKDIRVYFKDYAKYNDHKWSWRINQEDSDLYMKYRARKSDKYNINKDLEPIFDSIEKDADRFNLCEITYTDFFGIRWNGKKGTFEWAGDPDYEQHLYYFDDEYEEYCVSDEYTQDNIPEGFEHLDVNRYYDVKNVKDIKYSFIVENHLFKDSSVELIYGPDGDSETVYSNITDVALALLKYGKTDLYKKLCEEVDKHFKQLKNSNSKDISSYYPGCDADTYFKKHEVR